MLSEEQQQLVQRINAEQGSKIGAVPFYLLAKGEQAGPISLGTHVNPKLALHSSYFGALDQVFKCVERNAGAADGSKVCQKELKSLRLAAFDDKLTYHEINQRHFLEELSFKKGQSPY